MRWSAFFIFALLALLLELGLGPLWTLPVGPYLDAAPSLVLILAVFVGLHAPREAAYGALFVLGVLTDLSRPLAVVEPVRDIVLLGPATLGYVAATYVLMQFRTIVYRDSPVTMAVMTFAAGLAVHLVLVMLLMLRRLLPTDEVPDFDGSAQLLQRVINVIYSAILAAPATLLLRRTQRWWAFIPARGMAARGGLMMR